MAAPNTPTLALPLNGSSVDLAAGSTFDWVFSDSDGGDTQSAWAIRRKIGAGAYEYYNVATGIWDVGIVWNTDTASQFTFPASKWVNGNTYNWSVNTKDALGAAGPFAPDSLVVGSSTPVATVNSPSGLITDTSYPEVSWDFTQDQSQPQTEFEVKIFTDEAYGGGGFDPESSTIVWTSGVITSSAEVITPTLPLPNADTYRAYVRVRAGGVWSVWVYSQFTLSLLIPEAPILTLNPLPGTASIALGVLARLNLLSEVNSNIEASVGDWLDELNSLTPAQFATSPIEGTYSLLSIVAAAYEDIDANFTDYDAVDSSFADYDAMSIYIS